MIRLLFRVLGQDGASALHSAEVHGSKSALLLDPKVEIIGFEDCREINPRISISFAEQIALAKQNGKELRDIIAASKLWVPQNMGLNPENKPVVDEIKEQEIPEPNDIGLGGPAMDYRDLYEQKEVQPPEAKSLPAGYFEVDVLGLDKEYAESSGHSQPALCSGIDMKLWMLMRPSGEFVKSTTEEGGESYISCTSEEEAVKVAEHQKVFDIECVPYRVL